MTNRTIEIDIPVRDIRLDLTLPPDVSIRATAQKDFVVETEPATVQLSVVGTGPPGPPGTSILVGSGAPLASEGEISQFYLDQTGKILYGPKRDTIPIWPIALRSA